MNCSEKPWGIFLEKYEVRGGQLDDFRPEDLDAVIEAAKAETARRASNAGESGDTDSSGGHSYRRLLSRELKRRAGTAIFL
jgi:hypothetical protein